MTKIVASKEIASQYKGAEKYVSMTEAEFNKAFDDGEIKVYPVEHFDGFRIIDGKFV